MMRGTLGWLASCFFTESLAWDTSQIEFLKFSLSLFFSLSLSLSFFLSLSLSEPGSAGF